MINSDTGHATLLHSFQGEEGVEYMASMIVFDDHVAVTLGKYLYTFKVTTDC